MTLIISEVSRFGIAMVADSAITETYPSWCTLSSGLPTPPTVRIGAQKLIPIKAINAAVSVWGFGSVGAPSDLDATIPMDCFLFDFANSIVKGTSIEDVGHKLAEVVNARIRVGKVRGGFHLAGYKEENRRRFPVLFHIHTGNNSNGENGPLKLNRDFPYDNVPNTEEWLRRLETTMYWLRNGEFDTYAYFFDYLNKLMEQLHRERGFICPDILRFSTELEARGRFLKLQLQTICEFYRLSNRKEIIAMPISWLTISPEGISHFEQIVI